MLVKAGLWSALAGVCLLLSGCTASLAGVVAVSRVGDGMRVAIVPCDNEHIRILVVYAQSDESGEDDEPVLGRLKSSSVVESVTSLDPAQPPAGWTGTWISSLEELRPGVRYTLRASGGNWSTNNTYFTREELERMPEGSWIYRDVESAETVTASDVESVASRACDG